MKNFFKHLNDFTIIALICFAVIETGNSYIILSVVDKVDKFSQEIKVLQEQVSNKAQLVSGKKRGK